MSLIFDWVISFLYGRDIYFGVVFAWLFITSTQRVLSQDLVLGFCSRLAIELTIRSVNCVAVCYTDNCRGDVTATSD